MGFLGIEPLGLCVCFNRALACWGKRAEMEKGVLTCSRRASFGYGRKRGQGVKELAVVLGSRSWSGQEKPPHKYHARGQPSNAVCTCTLPQGLSSLTHGEGGGIYPCSPRVSQLGLQAATQEKCRSNGQSFAALSLEAKTVFLKTAEQFGSWAPGMASRASILSSRLSGQVSVSDGVGGELTAELSKIPAEPHRLCEGGRHILSPLQDDSVNVLSWLSADGLNPILC